MGAFIEGPLRAPVLSTRPRSVLSRCAQVPAWDGPVVVLEPKVLNGPVSPEFPKPRAHSPQRLMEVAS